MNNLDPFFFVVLACVGSLVVGYAIGYSDGLEKGCDIGVDAVDELYRGRFQELNREVKRLRKEIEDDDDEDTADWWKDKE